MVRFSIQLVGVTVFALALISYFGSGEASQSVVVAEPVLWADTVHINTQELETPRQQERDKGESFLRDVRMLPETAFKIRNNYMEEIDHEEIVKAGIRGMLENLDRFSVLMEERSYDALMESTHGKYEGLGMQIDSRDDHIQIITPIEGTPAYRMGLRAGDVILEIDDESTSGMTTSDAADRMRGSAGTSVRLLIERAGLADKLEFEVERAVIELKSVPYYGVVPGTDIGYVRLSRFAEETSRELREAIAELNERNVSSLIFDLRSNGGGLLDQATATAELFLEQGNEVVYTRGRYESSERHFYSERQPLFPDKPLVILVNEGTASASEIVSGAVQDWDRGLIVGATTYGKGLVQQIFPVSNDGSMALKLTTAKYYVPSGRCIQKPERQSKHPSRTDEVEEEPAEGADSMEVSGEEVFYTNGGRMVYGGGGIVPDLEIESETYKPIEINLERQQLIFDFAIQYVADHADVAPAAFEVTEDVLSEFRAFVEGQEFEYKTSMEVAVEELREQVDDDGSSELFSSTLDSLDLLIVADKSDDFDESQDYIKRALRREVLSAIAGQKGVYEELILKSDKAVLKAVEILSQPAEYGRLITEGQTKAELN